MVAAAAGAVPIAMELVDSNGLLPVRAVQKAHATAHAFRRALHDTLPAHLPHRPAADPLAASSGPPPALPTDVIARWPNALAWLDAGGAINDLPSDRRVRPVAVRGGQAAARAQLHQFLQQGLPNYGTARNHPDTDAASGLSPYLHWGHLSAHEVFDAVMAREGWLSDTPRRPLERGAAANW